MRRLYIKVMTPILNIFLLSVLFALFACGEKDYTPKKYMGLKGKIASVRDTVFDCTSWGFLPGYEKLRTVEITDFDTAGNIIKTATCNADSSYVTITEFVYRDDILFSTNGRVCVGKDLFTNTSERISIENDTIKYKGSNNDNQHWTSEVNTTGKYHLEHTKGKYGYTKDETWADNDNNIIKAKFVLLSNESEFANGSNVLEEINTMKYDKDGNLTESIHIEDKDTTVTVHSYHQYDKYGNWTEERTVTDKYVKKLIKRKITYVEN